MRKNLRTVKTALVMGILLVSVFVAITPSGSAAMRHIISFDPTIVVAVESDDLSSDVMPLGSSRQVDLNITYSISGTLAPLFEKFLSSQEVDIYLSIEPTPDWLSANIRPNVIRPKITIGGKSEKATVDIKITENAPARGTGEITIKLCAKEKCNPFIVKVSPLDTEYTFPVDLGYLPTISVKPETNFKMISPGETADFDIDIENLGNGKTEISFKVVEIPKGWSIGIPSSHMLGSRIHGDEPSSTVRLTVQPPLNFGYHYDKETFKVEITPSYFGAPGDPKMTGKTYEEIFIVESRGFSTPGFETVLAMFALLSVVLLVKKRRH